DGRTVRLSFLPGRPAGREGWTACVSPESADGQIIRCYEAGSLTYKVALPAGLRSEAIESLELVAEAASRCNTEKSDWPNGVNNRPLAQLNPPDNPVISPPQTAPGRVYPTDLRVTVNGVAIAAQTLPDCPADARAILTYAYALGREDWGAYGYLVRGKLEGETLVRALRGAPAGEPMELAVRFEVPAGAAHKGGLTLFGARRGRYPSDPAVIVRLK
ncbi:MAG: hypothetical protein M1457_00580, partial [bacterium]|nr:hypothetical protein [bacterium]